MSGYLQNAAVFLISILFGLYLLAVMLRFLLQLVRADYYNPLCQFLITITNPPLRPLRRWVPGLLGVDWPSLILLVLLQGAELCIITLISVHKLPAMAGMPLLILARLIGLCVWIYIVIIIIQVILSWVQPGAYNPATVLMHQLSAPLLRPLRRLLPPAGGMDWSPLVAIILLNLTLLLVVTPLSDLGYYLAGLAPMMLY